MWQMADVFGRRLEAAVNHVSQLFVERVRPPPLYGVIVWTIKVARDKNSVTAVEGATVRRLKIEAAGGLIIQFTPADLVAAAVFDQLFCGQCQNEKRKHSMH